jgi:hypothetical protein
MGKWPNGRRHLTTNQEAVFRVIFTEEIESGATPADAYREAERFMREDALPDWQQFWKDWNTPYPLAPFFAMVTGLALISAVVQHADRVGGMLAEAVKPLRYAIGDDE